MQALTATPAYERGDPDTVAAYYRIHYSAALAHLEQLDPLVDRLRAGFTPENILQGRAIEECLWSETLGLSDYTLLQKLTDLCIPTLVLHGEDDFVPVVCATHIAEAIPDARLVILPDCGHFAYIEAPDDVHREMTGFFADM
jgi:proline iminopeptidase